MTNIIQRKDGGVVAVHPYSPPIDGTDKEAAALSDPGTNLIERFVFGMKENTRDAYRSDLISFFGSGFANLDDAKNTAPIHVTDWVREMSSNRKPATIERRTSTLRTFFNWLIDDFGLLNRNPVTKRAVGKRRRSKQGFRVRLSTENIRDMLEYAGNRDTETALRDWTMIKTFVFTGLRVSELCSMQTDHLQQERGKRVIVIPSSKGSAEAETVPLVPEIDEAIRDHMQYYAITGGHLWLSHSPAAKGNPITRKGVWLIINKIAKGVGLDVSPA